MKTILRFVLTACAASGGLALAQETKKPEAVPGPPKVEIGPISVAVEVSSSEGDSASKVPYLGVITSPVAPQLRAQLDLAEGMGLSVDAVAKNSPAEQAGVQQYDVLKKFNDQMLCAQDQLAVLVKAAGKGAKVNLVVMRGGKEQNLSAVIGEHDAPEGGKASFSINGMPGINIEVGDLEKLLKDGLGGVIGQAFGGATPGKPPGGIHQNWDEMKKKQEQHQKDIQAQIDAAIRKAQEGAKGAAGAGGGGKAQVFSIYPGGNTQSMVSVSDADGTIEITDANGVRSVKIKDPSGKEIHAGPLNNQVDHDAVPEKFRDKVKDAESKIKTTGIGGLKKKAEKKLEQFKKPGGDI